VGSDWVGHREAGRKVGVAIQSDRSGRHPPDRSAYARYDAAARPSRPLKAVASVVVVMVMIVVVVIMMMVMVVMMMVVMMVIFSHDHRLFSSGSGVAAALFLGAQHLLSIRNGLQQLGK
jgi:hypothetical protein